MLASQNSLKEYIGVIEVHLGNNNNIDKLVFFEENQFSVYLIKFKKV